MDCINYCGTLIREENQFLCSWPLTLITNPNDIGLVLNREIV